MVSLGSGTEVRVGGSEWAGDGPACVGSPSPRGAQVRVAQQQQSRSFVSWLKSAVVFTEHLQASPKIASELPAVVDYVEGDCEERRQ